MATTRLSVLSRLVSENVALLESCIHSNDLPSPSFDASIPPLPVPFVDAEAESARNILIEAASELKDLLGGLRELVNPNVSAVA